MINIEVVYGTAENQVLKSLQVKPGTTAIEAAQAANLNSEFPDLDLENSPLGIFSKKTSHNNILKDGDRLEIYRPLTIDPMANRRIRANKKKDSHT